MARYFLSLQWQIEKKVLLPLDNLITTKQYQYMALEIFGNLIGPLPGLQDMSFLDVYPDRGVSIETYYNVVLLATALLIRLYLFLRFGLSASKYLNSRMQRLCHINGTEATFMYSVKAFK